MTHITHFTTLSKVLKLIRRKKPTTNATYSVDPSYEAPKYNAIYGRKF